MQRKQQPRRQLGQKPLKVLLQLASDNSVALPQVAIKKMSISGSQNLQYGSGVFSGMKLDEKFDRKSCYFTC
jgi:hypothetical protein